MSDTGSFPAAHRHTMRTMMVEQTIVSRSSAVPGTETLRIGRNKFKFGWTPGQTQL